MDEKIVRKFRLDKWGKYGIDETVSGSGSTLLYTQSIREVFPEIFKEFNIKFFLDAPCGDFNWMKEVNLNSINYLGLDIVDDIIKINKEKYAKKNIDFRLSDITDDLLPDADLMLTRDFLFHMPHLYIFKFFVNFLRSNIKYILVTTNYNTQNISSNLKEIGKFSPVNLFIDPFSFSNPLKTIYDYVPSKSSKKSLLLFSKEQIYFFLSRSKI